MLSFGKMSFLIFCTLPFLRLLSFHTEICLCFHGTSGHALWTYGTLVPDEAVSLAAKVLSEHLNLFIDLSENAKTAEVMVEKEDDEKEKVLDGIHCNNPYRQILCFILVRANIASAFRNREFHIQLGVFAA